ncbi:MAG: hypothetical protein ABFD46_07460 [Armatimonadota bacterium]
MKNFTWSPYLVYAFVVTAIGFAAFGDEPRLMAVLGTIVILPIVVLLSSFTPVGWKRNHWLLRSYVSIPLAVLILVSIGLIDWPLRLHFAMIRPTLNSLAARAEKGEPVKDPVRVGLFHLQPIEHRSGAFSLGLYPSCECEFDGFAKTTPAGAKNFNLWYTISLDKDWQFIWED